MSIAVTEFTPSDLPAMLELVRSLDVVRHLDLEALRYGLYADPHYTPDLHLWALRNGSPVGCCVASLHPDAGLVKLFGVPPHARGRGVATALFDTLEGRLRERGAPLVAVEGRGPSYFLPGVDIAHTEAVSFLLQRGYTTDRVARVDMEVDLRHTDLDTGPAVERLQSAGYTLRRATAEDAAGAVALCREHFSAVWQVEVTRAGEMQPPRLFVALREGRVLGFAAYDVAGNARFGPMGTHPDLRGLGIGGALLKMCLASLRDAGYTASEISWAGPVAFYARTVGARIHRVYWGLRKTL